MIIYQNVFISWNWVMFIPIVSWRASVCIVRQNSVWFPVWILIFFIASILYSVAGTAQEMPFSLNLCAKKSIGVNNPVLLLPLDGLVKQGSMWVGVFNVGTLALPGRSSAEDTVDTAVANMIRKWDWHKGLPLPAHTSLRLWWVPLRGRALPRYRWPDTGLTL